MKNTPNRVQEFVKTVQSNDDTNGHIGYIQSGKKIFIDYVSSDEFEFTMEQWAEVQKELPKVLFVKE